MRIDDLAGAISDGIAGMEQVDVEASLLELFDELVAQSGSLTGLVDADRIAELELPPRTEQRLRSLFAERRGGGS